MRNLVVVAAASVLLVACGSDKSGSASGPQRPGGALSGTVGGRAFAPTEIQAVSAGSGSTPCALPGGINVAARAVAILLSTSPGACTELNSAQCIFHAGEQKVRLIISMVSLGGGAEPALNPGVYTVGPSLTTISQGASGTYVAYAEATTAPNPDPTCVATTSASTGGAIWIDSISGPVTGAATISFADGSSISGTFSVPLCGSAPPVCATASALFGGGLCTLPASCP